MSNTDINVFRGDDTTLNLTFTEDDIPVNITGWTVFFTIKVNQDDTDDEAVISKKITSHTIPDQGKTSVPMTDTETYTLAGQYYYDIQVKKTDNTIFTCLEGTITFKRDITRRIS